MYSTIQHLLKQFGAKTRARVETQLKAEENMFSRYGSILGKFGSNQVRESLGNIEEINSLPNRAVGLESLSFIQEMMNQVRDELLVCLRIDFSEKLDLFEVCFKFIFYNINRIQFQKVKRRLFWTSTTDP